MQRLLIIELAVLCSLFWAICYLNTGGDERNIKNYSSYPDKVQRIVEENPALREKIKVKSQFISFLSNVIVFGLVLFIFGIFIKQQSFFDNFVRILILGQCLNFFDLVVIDLLWWRNSKRIRFRGTEDMKDIYRNPDKHLMSFLKGIPLFVLISALDGLLLSFIG